MSSGPIETEFAPESQETENQEFSEPQLPAGDEPGEPTPSEDQQSNAEQGTKDNSVKDNPAWKDILDPVPEHFHSHLKGHLSRMERYAQEQQQEAALYKEFKENNISKDQLVQGLQFINLLNTNPRGVYDYLQQQYNYAQTQEAVANSQEQQRGESQPENLELGEEQSDIFKDPRYQQVSNQAQFAAQAVQEMQERAIRQQMEYEVTNDLNSVETHPQYKNLPRDLVIRTALGMAAEQQAKTGREVGADVMAAAKSLWETGAFAPKSRVNLPPNLSRTRSGVPADTEPEFGKMTRQQRTAYLAAAMGQLDNQ